MLPTILAVVQTLSIHPNFLPDLAEFLVVHIMTLFAILSTSYYGCM